jgi:DNA gyrase subunit B
MLSLSEGDNMGENIKVLNEKDKVRKKISVWLGSNTHSAVLHCIKELVGNSVDEINKGNGNTIEVIIENKKTITIIDNCKGLPVEGINKDTGIENYKLLTEVLFAGTKYENGIENNDYTVGLNGIFLTVLTRASENIQYEISRPNGNVYSFSYYKGDLKEPLKIIGKFDRTYTKISYTLDDEVFEENHYTIDEICQIARQQASLINGKIVVTDKEHNISKLFKYENGIKDLLIENVDTKHTIGEAQHFQRKVNYTIPKDKREDIVLIDMVYQYTKEDDDNTQIEFLNGSNLIHHGTIYEGIVTGFKNGFHKYIKDNSLYTKNEKPISKDDVLTGLNYIVNFKSFFPVYANQTKFATDVSYYKDIIQETIEYNLEVLSNENKELMVQLCTQILVNKRVREKADNNRQKIKKELEESTNSIQTRPDKYVPCRSKDRTKKRLILIEGDSALNAVKQSRDAEFDAIFPLKGKPINCLKKSIDEIMKNEEVKNIVKLMGCGVSYKGKSVKGLPKFDIEKAEFSEIDILSDGDEDGFHIRCLLIGMFYMLMPEVIYTERLKVLEAPLYRIIDGKKKEYICYDELERNKILDKLNGRFVETRFKGLGGLNPQLSASTIMNIESRRVKVVTMKDVEECVRMLEMFLDDDSDSRKEFIKNFGHEYFDYSIYED